MRLWTAVLDQDFEVTNATTPEGLPCTPQEAYAAWMAEYVIYGPIARRVRKAWATITAVLQRDLPEMIDTLRPGCAIHITATQRLQRHRLSEADLDEIQQQQRPGALPYSPTLRMMYRVHDGQEPHDGSGTFYGLFGRSDGNCQSFLLNSCAHTHQQLFILRPRHLDALCSSRRSCSHTRPNACT